MWRSLIWGNFFAIVLSWLPPPKSQGCILGPSVFVINLPAMFERRAWTKLLLEECGDGLVFHQSLSYKNETHIREHWPQAVASGSFSMGSFSRKRFKSVMRKYVAGRYAVATQPALLFTFGKLLADVVTGRRPISAPTFVTLEDDVNAKLAHLQLWSLNDSLTLADHRLPGWELIQLHHVIYPGARYGAASEPQATIRAYVSDKKSPWGNWGLIWNVRGAISLLSQILETSDGSCLWGESFHNYELMRDLVKQELKSPRVRFTCSCRPNVPCFADGTTSRLRVRQMAAPWVISRRLEGSSGLRIESKSDLSDKAKPHVSYFRNALLAAWSHFESVQFALAQQPSSRRRKAKRVILPEYEAFREAVLEGEDFEAATVAAHLAKSYFAKISTHQRGYGHP